LARLKPSRYIGSRHHIQMIPAIAIAEERDPLTVRRGLRAAVRVAGHAPEFLLDDLVQDFRFTAGDVCEQRCAALEVRRRAIDDEACTRGELRSTTKGRGPSQGRPPKPPPAVAGSASGVPPAAGTTKVCPGTFSLMV